MLPRHVAAATDESYVVFMHHGLSLHTAPVLRGCSEVVHGVVVFFVEQLAALH